jgi:hypothetical protein
MKAVARFSVAALALGLVAAPASAQLAGLPVVYAPAGTGVTIGGMFGRGLNNDSGKFNSAGGMVTIGLPNFWVGAGASYFDFDVLKDISFGGQAGYKLPLPPTTPVSVAIVAGASYMSNDLGGTLGSVKTLFIPAGASIGFNVPSASVAVTPWVSPQFRYMRVSNGGSASNSSWGVSGGVGIGLPMGVGFDLAVDYDGESKGFVGGAGIHYTIKTPGLGGGGM